MIRRTLVGFAIGVTALLAGATIANASEPVTGWVRHNATPLDTVDPARPLDDLRALRHSVDVIVHRQTVSRASGRGA